MPENLNKENKLIKQWILQTSVFLICYLPILLAIAGNFIWFQGWLYWIILFVFLALHPLLLIPINPQLLAERARGTRVEGTKSWDKVLTMIGPGLMPFASQIISALDHRFSWSSIPIYFQIPSLILTCFGYGIFLWAMVTNGFFAEGVRIQTERGHLVCDSGPYAFVRHPGYFGSIIAILGTPLIMDSLWGLLPAFLGAVIIGVRTYLEDEMLNKELDGYRDYANRVKYRLIPGLF